MQQVDDFKACFDVAAAGGRIFLRTIDSVICWDCGAAKVGWEYKLSGDRVGGKKEVGVWGSCAVTTRYNDQKSAELIAIEAATGLLAWSLDLGLRPEARCTILAGDLLFVFGPDPVGKYALQAVDMSSRALAWRMPAPYAQYLFQQDGLPYLAGLSGIARVDGEVLATKWEGAVLGSCAWRGRQWLLVALDADFQAVGLAWMDTNGVLHHEMMLPVHEEAAHWVLSSETEEALVARNVSSLELLIFTWGPEGIQLRHFKRTDSVGYVKATTAWGSYFVMVEDLAESAYRVARVESDNPNQTLIDLPAIEEPRYLGRVDDYLVIGGLLGTQLWEATDLDLDTAAQM